jgi:hypothetical protein
MVPPVKIRKMNIMCKHILRTWRDLRDKDDFPKVPKFYKCNFCGEILEIRWGGVKNNMVECSDCGSYVEIQNAHCTSCVPLQNFCKPPRYWGDQYQCKKCSLEGWVRMMFPNSDEKVTV